MAEKEKRKISSKGLIAISILLLAVIVVVVVIACLPKKVSKVINKTNSFTSEMFLTDDNIYADYIEFTGKVKNDPRAKEYFGQQTDNALAICMDLITVMNFYNNSMIFAKDNKTFQNNYNKINKSLNSAIDAQDDMEGVLAKFKATINKEEQNSTFICGAWEDFAKAFDKYISGITKTIDGLDAVYSSCIPKGVLSNDLNTFTRTALKSYLRSLNTLSLEKSTNLIEYFTGFTQYFKTEDRNNILVNYTYSEQLKSQYERMNNIYRNNHDILNKMVSSIDENGVKLEAGQSSQDYALLKTFIEGGLEA